MPSGKNIGTVSTQQFSPPGLANSSSSSTTSSTGATSTLSSTFTLSDLLNVFLFRPDINLAATIQALQQQNILEILAEPNLLTASGKEASFLAGGEFPYPVLQGTATGGSQGITIQFKEFGIRLGVHADDDGRWNDSFEGGPGSQLARFHKRSNHFRVHHSRTF